MKQLVPVIKMSIQRIVVPKPTRPVTAASRNRQVEATIAEIDSIINPPAPPPEPEPIAADDGLGSPNIADEDFNPRYWLQKSIFRR